MIAMNSRNYQAVKKNILELGLKENEDFVWWKEKLKAIIYGNCHMNVIKEILLSSSEFKRRYTLNIHSVNSLDEKVLENDLAYTDLVVSQDIKDDNKLKVPGVNDIKKLAMGVVLTVPNLYGMNFFYPQLCGKINIDLSFYNSEHVNRNGKGDSFVENSYENGCDMDICRINWDKSRVSPMSGMDGKEIFIYGCVKKESGLKFEQEQICNNYSQTLTGAPYSIEEWVEDYYKMIDVQRGE